MRKIQITLGIATTVIALNLPFFMGSCSSCSSEEEKADTIVVDTLPHPTKHNIDMGNRLDSLMHSPLRIDTAKISISVYDLNTNTTIYQHKSQTLRAPASCMKLVTAITALEYMGSDYMYNTKLYMQGKQVGDTLDGSLLLVADDDPMFFDFISLADSTKRKGIKAVTGGVIYQLARTDTLKAHPAASPWDILHSKLPVLLKGEKCVKQEFEYMLTCKGIKLKREEKNQGNAEEGKVKRDSSKGEKTLIAETSHPLNEILAEMLIHSSNIKAEAIFYHFNKVLNKTQNDGISIYSHKKKHKAEEFVENKLGINIQKSKLKIDDGSGLSPESRLTTDFFIKLLKYAYKKQEIFDFFINSALATPQNAERQGSLRTRLYEPIFKEAIFAKTGTIVTIGASSLSGYAKGSDGHWYAFSIIGEDTPIGESHVIQESICRELVR